MELIQAATAAVGGWVAAHHGRGALRSLLVDGVIGGVGSVFAFLPQILILFALHRHAGRLRLHGPGRLPDGPADGPRGLERQIVHSPAVVVRLRRAGHHGHARDRERARPADDDPRGAAADLLGPAADLCPADRGFHPRAKLLGGLLNLQGLTLAGAVSAGDRGRRGRCPGAEADDPSRPDAAVRDGAAQLQVAVAADGVFPHGRAGWVFLRCAGTLILAVSILVWAAPIIRTIRRPRISSNSAKASWAGPAR